MGERFVQVTYRMKHLALWLGYYKVGFFVLLPRLLGQPRPYVTVTWPGRCGGCLLVWIGPFGWYWRLR